VHEDIENGFFDFLRIYRKITMANSKQIPCVYFNSHEGCTNSDEKCKYAHKPMCSHIGCLQRGKTLTHLKENCGFIKVNTEKAPEGGASAPLDPRTQLLDKVYEALTKQLAGKFTGMFNEAFEESELKELLTNPEKLKSDMAHACQTVISHNST
jgi:hypothetical protein